MKRIIKSLMTILVMAGLLLTNVHMISAEGYASDTYETTIYYESHKYNRAADIQVIAEWQYQDGVSVTGIRDNNSPYTSINVYNANTYNRDITERYDGDYHKFITTVSATNAAKRKVIATIYQECDIYGQTDGWSSVQYTIEP